MPARRAYHHGNLKEALLQAALALIAEAGPAGCTLREVARRAGVSHNAPYRHFRDKDELLAAVATQGFEELTQSMLDAARKHRTALARFRSSGLAYVDFALRRPEHFTVMFDAPLRSDGVSTEVDAGARAFETLVGFVRDCQAEGQLSPGDSMQIALVAWSLVHGVAKLAVAGRFPGWTKSKILQFAGFAVDASFHGLRT
jgi:AcrR family transcriptional regulator